MQALLEVSEVECRYGSHKVLESVSFTLGEGEIGCLIGPSGCGKTTLLHAIAGFQPLHAGSIHLQRELISSPGATTPPEKRRIGLVFQDYALFPHLSVEDNIAFGLKALPRAERRARVDELLALIRLQSFARQYPHQLSGGQQQRVALARALAPRPQLLLMDEPFSNLDTELRRSLAAEVRQILRGEGTAALIVTHDRGEAFAAGDKLGVLTSGRLQQWDTPESVYRTPASAAVAGIVGEGSLLRARMLAPGILETELGRVKLVNHIETQEMEVFVRSEEIVPGPHPDAVDAEVVAKSFLGRGTLYEFRLPGGRLIEAVLDADLALAPGDTVPLRIGTPVLFSDAT